MKGYRPITRMSVVAIAVILLGSSAHSQSPESMAPALDRLMTDLHERGYFNGAIVVGSDDEILYEKGFGYANVGEAIPFTPETPADVASIAKTFTAAAVLMLEAKGRISLDEPVTTYLPEFPYLHVRVRHLLAHTSGLLPTAVYFAGVNVGNETRTNQRLLDIIAEQKPPLSFVPGTAFQYSNGGFDLAALLIERVTGVSYASFLEERIFAPLKMESAFVRPARLRDWKGTPTLGYRVVDGQLIPYDPPDNEANYGSQVYASARDIHAWTRSFYSKPVLSDSALQRGLEPPSVGNGADETHSGLKSIAGARAGVGAVIAAISCVLAGCQLPPEPEAVRAAAEALLSDLHARGLFNGAVVLGRDGEIVYEGAWGPANVEAGVPFTPDTPVDGGSLAKNFTAAAVWMLVDEGKLDLDAAVQRHVPEFPHPKTTVRHLIEHSAALPDWEDWGGLTNEGMVGELRKRRILPSFTPGSRYEYCNACYDVAALIVERVSGEKWDAFLRKHIFDPLRMESTFLRPVRFAEWAGVRTLSYQRIDGELSILDVYDNEALYGASNLYFSARDLHRWITSWYSHPVLSDAALARGMETPVFANEERSAFNRLAWYRLPDRRAYVFTGHWKGFHHEIYWDADRHVSVVWVTNVLEAKPLPPLLTRALIDIVEGKAPSLPIADPVFRAPESGESLEPLIGTFDVASVGRVTVTTDGEGLFFQVDRGARHRSFPAGSYTVPDFYARVWFSEIEAGRYRRLHWLSLLGVATGERLSSVNR